MVDYTALVNNFLQKSKELEGELKKTIGVLSAEKIPCEDDILNLTNSMFELRKIYFEIRSEALTVKSEITDDVPVSTYKVIFDEYETLKLSAQIESIVKILKRFVSVVTDDSAYKEALAPYQKEAAETLKALESDDLPLDSKLGISCSNQEAFLHAISLEDEQLSTDEGESLLDFIESNYSGKVYRGVMRGYYKEPAQSTSDVSEIRDKDAFNTNDEAQANDCLTEEEKPEEGKVLPEDTTTFSSDEETQKPEEGEVIFDDISTSFDDEEVVVAQQAMVEAISNAKIPSNASASSFKKELPTMPLMVRDILPLVTKFGAISESQLLFVVSKLYKGWEDSNESDVKYAIDNLIKKGILVSFDSGTNGIGYVLSSYGKTLLGKATIKTFKLSKTGELFWHLPVDDVELTADKIIEKKKLVSTLEQVEMAVAYLDYIHDPNLPEKFFDILRSIQMVDGVFQVSIIWGYQDYICRIGKPSADVIVKEDTLFVSKDGERINISQLDDKNVFLLEDGILKKWDGSWKTEVTSAIKDNEADCKTDNTEIEDQSDNCSSPQLEIIEKPSTENDVIEKTQSEDEFANQAQGEFTTEGETLTSDDTENGSLRAKAQTFVELADPPSDDEFVSMALELISNEQALIDPDDKFSNLAAAIALLHAASTIDGYEKSKLLFDQMVLSTGLSDGYLENTGSVIARTFPESNWRDNEARVFASYCLALFSPCMAYDYNLRNTAEMLLGNFDEFFPSLSAFKPLLNELSGIGDISPEEGLSDNVLDMMGNHAKRSKRLDSMKNRATELLATLPKIKAKLHGIPELNAACFGKDSDLNLCMQIIKENKRSDAGFVNEVLDSYCFKGGNPRQIDKSAIENKIDDEWRNAIEGKSTHRVRKLGSEPRRKVQDGFSERLDLMQKWLSYDEGKFDSETLSKLKSKKIALANIVDELEDAGTIPMSVQSSVVLDWMLKYLKDKLDSAEHENTLFLSFLKTGVISLDDNKMPIIDAILNKVKFYEPWRNVLRHVCEPMKTFDEARNMILDDDSSDLFDNLRQLNHINNVIADNNSDYKTTDLHLRQAEETAENATEKFQDSLEISYTYGLINEIQKEDLANSVEVFQSDFFARADFGCWRQFLRALDLQVDAMASPLGEELRARLQSHKNSLKKGTTSSLLNEAERLLIEEKNYTVVEDYLNRFEAGQNELTDELSAKLHDPDLFSEFISDDVFKPLQDICTKSKGTPLSSFGKNFLKTRYPSEWTSRQKESSESLINAWPTSFKRFNGELLAKLMKSIGFKVRGVPECIKKIKLEHYRVNVRPEASDKTDYRHPISAFGTQIKSPLNVLVLYGNHTPQEIIDIVAGESIVGEAIVFINYPISLQNRRQMAELFHTQKSRLTSFLLIDQILALYLALHQETERMPLMLKCTLPFTYYQPFVRDSGPTADEMFCGRERELQTIIDPNGATVVYGGRQLGKTALLERAKSLRMKPDNGEYAIYVSILNCDSEESASLAISDAMRRAKLDFPKCSSLREVCKAIDSIMKKDDASRVLLLIDESDKFLESISDSGYSALQPMVDFKRETKNNFKFVLAGLHNVSRAKNATSKNGIFGQLGEPLCIKPLTPNEALQLISRPLTYLGFQVDRYPHLETILTSTNYYPGILQFFGYTLVETMTKQYGDYYRATDGNPPYTLHKEQLGAIMNRSDLNNSIKEKFRWSLELDSRYFMIARCIALMCYDSSGQADEIDIQKGFLADEIKKWADDLGIFCLENETSQSYMNLLDEMVDMGILVRPAQNIPRYRLRRNSFLNIIGSDLDSVLEDIDNNNVKEG